MSIIAQNKTRRSIISKYGRQEALSPLQTRTPKVLKIVIPKEKIKFASPQETKDKTIQDITKMQYCEPQWFEDDLTSCSSATIRTEDFNLSITQNNENSPFMMSSEPSIKRSNTDVKPKQKQRMSQPNLIIIKHKI